MVITDKNGIVRPAITKCLPEVCTFSGQGIIPYTAASPPDMIICVAREGKTSHLAGCIPIGEYPKCKTCANCSSGGLMDQNMTNYCLRIEKDSLRGYIHELESRSPDKSLPGERILWILLIFGFYLFDCFLVYNLYRAYPDPGSIGWVVGFILFSFLAAIFMSREIKKINRIYR